MIKETPILKRCEAALRESLKQTNPTAQFSDGREVRVARLEDNLVPGVDWPAIEQMYLDADGKETESKMLAPWSSSALVANSFGPWVGRSAGLSVLGSRGFPELHLEEKCPNGLPGNDPNLDAVLASKSEVLAIESKLLEYLRGGKKAPFPAKYELIEDFRTGSRWAGAMSVAGSFRRLDAVQLIKHYFGVARTYGDRKSTIVYLYWEPTNAEQIAECVEHRNEIEEFANLVRPESGEDASVGFAASSYADHWRDAAAHSADADGWIQEHLDMLTRRYDIAV